MILSLLLLCCKSFLHGAKPLQITSYPTTLGMNDMPMRGSTMLAVLMKVFSFVANLLHGRLPLYRLTLHARRPSMDGRSITGRRNQMKLSPVIKNSHCTATVVVIHLLWILDHVWNPTP